MEAENWRLHQQQLATTNTDNPPQLCIDNFSFEELHHVMKRNGSQILGLFDEMSTMYSQLDLYKQSGSVMDRKTLITLNGGSSWSRNYRNYTASMKQTAFNMSGFIQPSFVEKMLLSDDADGFNDRQLFVFPPQRDVLLNELKLPIPSNIPSLKGVYRLLRTIHSSPHTYVLVGDALDTYRDYHDQLVRRQSRQVDGNIQGILSKARGYTARLAMILFALEQTLTHIIEGECDVCPNTSWSFDVSTSCSRAACTIMDYLIQQKLIIMDVTEVDEHNTLHADQLVQIPDAKRMRRLLLLPLEDSDGQITPSKLAQKHICAPTDGKYTVVKALELFRSASSMGFGEQVDHVVPSTNRKVSRFRKTPYTLLSSNARSALRQLRITEEEYNQTFPTSSTTPSTPSPDPEF